MSAYKKLGFGLCLVVSVFMLSSFLPHKTRALTQTITKDDIINCINSFKFTDIAHISCDTPNGKAIFVDNNPTNSGDAHNNYQETTGIFCNPQDNSTAWITAGKQTNFKIGDAGKDHAFWTNGIGYPDPSTNKCTWYQGDKMGNFTIPGSNTTGIANFLQFQNSGGSLSDSTVASLDGVTSGGGGGLQNRSYSEVSYSDGNQNRYVYAANLSINGTSCSGEVVAVTTKADGTATGVRFELKAGESASSPLFNMVNFLKNMGNTGGCGIGKVGFGLGDDKSGFGIIGTLPPLNSSIAGATPITNTSPAASTATCESSSSIGLEWIVCPLLRAIDSMVASIYGEVDAQLCFTTTTNENSLTSNMGCSDPNNKNNLLTTQVQQTWSLVRDLASAVLVIAMLVMVFSQAISFGPFDAYTVKKMLPKLAAAAILIQLSWFATKFAIDLSNDVGRGVQGLLYSPFGPKVSNINYALGHIGDTGTLAVGAGVGIFVGALFFSGLTIIGILLIALSGVAAVFVGLLVLLFRKALIILCVIFAPIALVAWVLPGTERYWKMWRETFSKLLMMFPMIAAMIAGGRIFGYIAGNASTGIMALLAVMVGFFGPLFVLPKTYKWGGQALGAIGGAVVEGSRGLRKKPKEYAMKQAAINREQKAQNRNERLADNSYRFGAVGRTWNSLLAGKYNPALRRDARENIFSGNLAKGRKAAEEAAVAGQVGSRFESLSHEQKLEDLDDQAQGLVGRHSGIDGSRTTTRLLALDQLATFGDWDRITNMRTNRQIPEAVWQRFMAKNIGAVHQQAPHLSPLASKAGMDGIAYEDMAGFKDEGFKEMIRQYQNAQVRWTKADDPSKGLYKGTLVDVAVAQGIDPALDPDGAETARREFRTQLATKAASALGDDQVRRRIADENLEDLQSIAEGGVGGATIQIINHGRNIPLPTDLTTPAAQGSLIEHLASGDITARNTVANRIGESIVQRVVITPAGHADETGFRTLMDKLHSQTAASPQAKQIYNQLLAQFHNSLDQIAQQAERDAVSAGLGPADVNAAVDTAIQHGTDKIDRLNGLGPGTPLNPLP